MSKGRYLPVQAILWVIAAYHGLVGIAATFFVSHTTTLAGMMFGVEVTMNSQTELLVRYLGAFAIAFGIMAAMAAIDPARNKTFIYGAVVYFFVRACDRVLFASLFAEHQVGGVPNWWRIVVIVAFAASLLWLMPRREKAS